MVSLPKISIITPSFNQGRFIEETLLSVINQNYPNQEYIIIDGGSTDDTIEIITKYEQYLAYWVSEKDNGQSEAINKGFRKATGDIICWINSDDILMPGALRRVADFFEDNKDLDFVNGNTVLIDENSNIITSHFTLMQKRWYAKRGIFYINQPAMFWKRNLFDTIGFLKEDFHTLMDKELLIRIFENNFRIDHLERILAGFRVHDMAKSAGGPVSMNWFLSENEKLYELYNKSYGQKPKLFFKLIYILEKVIKGVYFRKWFFTLKWKGKNVKELNCIE
jgi:glycosyltransferase involved in cell wall biosynthesis